jgi:hypothetical protein
VFATIKDALNYGPITAGIAAAIAKDAALSKAIADPTTNVTLFAPTSKALAALNEDAKAKALVDVANAQARAAEVRAQAYGGAVENVGKIASTAITEYNSPQARQQRELDRGQAILKARGQEQQPNDRQRVALGVYFQ